MTEFPTPKFQLPRNSQLPNPNTVTIDDRTGIVFISDIHLKPGDFVMQEWFASVLAKYSDGYAIFLLGDIFEYWIGDEQAHDPMFVRAINAIRAAASSTTVIYVPGNRDFLFSPRLSAHLGIKLFERRVVASFRDKSILCVHGDRHINDDTRYFAYCRLADSPQVRDLFLISPYFFRNGMAQMARGVSKKTRKYKVWSHAQITRTFIDDGDWRHDIIVSGHIHQPQHLNANLIGKETQFVVLGEWTDVAHIGVIDESGMSLREIRR